jgi:hypothetical protein
MPNSKGQGKYWLVEVYSATAGARLLVGSGFTPRGAVREAVRFMTPEGFKAAKGRRYLSTIQY